MTERQNDLVYDLFNLTGIDTHPIDITAYKNRSNEYLLEHSTQNVQFLMAKLFELPTTSEDDGLFATLPKQTTLIPREKPVPKEKKATHWEEFAKKKNMRLQDREKLVYDPVHDEFRPRFGFGRAKNELADDWVIEEKGSNQSAGGITASDPFLEKQQAKKKSQKQQVKNQKKNMGKSQEKTKIPAQLNIAALPRLDPKRARFELKDDLKDTYSMAAVSTASMGKFDKRLPKEPKKNNVKPKNKLSGKAAMGGSGETDEKQASLKLLDRVLKTNAQKKRAIKSNSANVFQQMAEQSNRTSKKVHLLGKNKARFTQGKDKKKGKGGQVGKKRGRNAIDF